jgi:hypothetical protein
VILSSREAGANQAQVGVIPQLHCPKWGVLPTILYLFPTRAQRGLAWDLRSCGMGIFKRGWIKAN